MTIKVINSGVDTSFSTKLNGNLNASLRSSGLNLGRALIDRSVDFSAEGGEWAEAYTDSNGRLNAVDTGLTTAAFDVDKYTAEDATTFTDATEYSTSSTTYVLKKTFSSINGYVRKHTNELKNIIGNGRTAYCQITFNYSDTTSSTVEHTAANNAGKTYSTKTYTNPSIEKEVSSIEVRIKHSSAENGSYVRYNKVYLSSTEEITHNLPVDSFSPTVSSSFGTALVEDWETGANIQYKLTNTTEDTGWLEYNVVSEFTAFTSAPTKCIVKLIPKTTNPTAGTPSIKAFCVYE